MSKIVKVQTHDIRQLGINPNHWYVVALSREVKTQPVGVMLWKQAMLPKGAAQGAIALYCDSKGPIHALEDRCPDRLVKLSHGQVLGDELECAYHGWRFNDKSECAAVPYLADNQKLPSCKIRRYPVKEQDGFIWLFPENVETRRQSRHEGDPFGYAFGTPDGERQLPTEGNPPAALVSPPAALARHGASLQTDGASVQNGTSNRALVSVERLMRSGVEMGE